MSAEETRFRKSVECMVSDGYGIASCASHCPDRGSEHAHLTTPSGIDFIAYPDGTAAAFDLTRGPAAALVPRRIRPLDANRA